MKILSILTQSKKAVAKNKALRKAKSLKRRQEALIDSLEDKKDDLINRKEALLSVNVESVNEETWSEDYQNIQVELQLITKQIEIANATLTELFTDEG